jgi:hypothetical protein
MWESIQLGVIARPGDLASVQRLERHIRARARARHGVLSATRYGVHQRPEASQAAMFWCPDPERAALCRPSASKWPLQDVRRSLDRTEDAGRPRANQRGAEETLELCS